jgi:tetratricopeptide (TPR) repeat protein
VLVVGIAAVAFAVVRATDPRPDGGYATGSILDNSDDSQRDLASVSNEEMEGVVAANPDIVPMRLALARRYFDAGDFSSALPHYLHILEIEPDPEALANVGWMAYLNDRADIAQGYLEQSLAVSPGYTQAQFFLANVLLFGLDDPDGAAPLLRQVIATPGLPSDVLQDAESLLAQATAS